MTMHESQLVTSININLSCAMRKRGDAQSDHRIKHTALERPQQLNNDGQCLTQMKKKDRE